MGNWSISIVGCGVHHNLNHPRDADKMAARFVNELRAAGHRIDYAAFTTGTQDLNLPSPESAGPEPQPPRPGASPP